MWSLNSPDAATTFALGRCLGEVAPPGTVVALLGELGAGKTCFAQGAGEGLGVQSEVVSPTFVLVSEHEAERPLLHADAYRIDAHELEGIGLEEQLEDWPGLALVEWAGRIEQALPLDHLQLSLHHLATGRRIEVIASGPRSRVVLEAWRARWEGQG